MLRPSMPGGVEGLFSLARTSPPTLSCSCARSRFSPPAFGPRASRLAVDVRVRSQLSSAVHPPFPQPFKVVHGPPETSTVPLSDSVHCPLSPAQSDTDPPPAPAARAEASMVPLAVRLPAAVMITASPQPP